MMSSTRCHLVTGLRKKPMAPALKKITTRIVLIVGIQGAASLAPSSNPGLRTKIKGRKNKAAPRRQLVQAVSQNSEFAMGIAVNTAPATGGVIADISAQ